MGLRRKVLDSKDFGGKKSEDRLNNLFTMIHYERMIPYEDDLEKEAGYGERLWKQEQKVDPWEILAAALIGRAAEDYVDSKLDGDEEMMRGLEAWFARNEYSLGFLNTLKRMMGACRTTEELIRLKHSIRLIF